MELKWVHHLAGTNILVMKEIFLAIDQFGASAPGEKVMEEYGFTVENVVARVKALLRNKIQKRERTLDASFFFH